MAPQPASSPKFMIKQVIVHVKPSSKKGSAIQTSLTGELIVFVREPAIDGKANRAVIELLAKHYEVPKSHVVLVSGRTSRHKRFNIN